MQFKCANCGGNVVYDPKGRSMLCENCNSRDSEEIINQQDCYSCVSCGAPLTVKKFTSATKCESCGSYSIVDEKINYPYGADVMLPFRISKEDATEILRKEFKNRVLCPDDFLSARTLEQLSGEYVPFWLYSYDTHAKWNGTATKVRVWRSGNKEYTETSRYAIYREMEIKYQRVPVDASEDMPDKIMDIMEPYNYKELEEFQEKKLSGFYAETYNMPPQDLEGRAVEKVNGDTDEWIRDSINGYDSVHANSKNYNNQPVNREFALMPVWKYVYRFHGKNLEYYVNGQTGKAYGKIPKSTGKTFFVAGSLLLSLICLGQAIGFILEVL